METSATPDSDARRNCSHDTSTKDSIMFLLIQQHLSLSADSASSQPCPTACGTFQTTLVSGLPSFWLDRQQMSWMMRTLHHVKNEVSVFALKT